MSSVSSVSGDPDLKDKLLTKMIHFISTRALSEMKIIERDVENLTAKKLEFLQLKSSIKNFIRDKQIAEEEESSPKIRKGDPDFDQFQDLRANISRLNQIKEDL